MKVFFVVNPTAGKGHAIRKVPEIKAAMEHMDDIEYDLRYTEKPGHASDIARTAAGEGYDIVFAVGGDGTVNEVVNGLVNTDAALAVLPCGSGNDFARSVEIKGDTGEIIRKVIGGTRKKIDVGRIDGRYFINIASAGFDAEVVLATQKAKKFLLSGSPAYITGLISTIFTYKPRKVKINLHNEIIDDRIILMAVANGKYYGGGMKAAPDAILDDGYFDVCIIRSMPKLKMLFLFPQFMKGRHKKFREVSFHRSDSVKIECENVLAVNVDGEVYTEKGAEFELIKNMLNIMVLSVS